MSRYDSRFGGQCPPYVLLPLFFLLITGCAEHAVVDRDPCGGAISLSEACVYDYGAHGLWYVLFVRCDGLIDARHSHRPGLHLFTRSQDLVFYSRCSGRGEVIDLFGVTRKLSDGAVLLCAVDQGEVRVEQVRSPLPPFRYGQDENNALGLYELTRNPRVAAFLSDDAKLRLLADWKLEQERRKQRERRAGG